MSSLFARHMNPFAAAAMRQTEDPLGSLSGGRQSIPNASFGDQLGDMDTHQRQMEMIQRVADALNQQNQHGNSGRASASSVDSATSGKIYILPTDTLNIRCSAKRIRHSSPDRANDKKTSESTGQQHLNGLDQLLKSSASTHLKLTSLYLKSPPDTGQTFRQRGQVNDRLHGNQRHSLPRHALRC